MKRIERSAIVPYSCQKMYDLVTDVVRYPEFLPGCASSVLYEKSETSMRARLNLSKAGVKQSFETRNTMKPPEQIQLELSEGPFKALKGEWNFTALSDDACKIVFWLEFEFSNFILNKTLGKMFEMVASEQVDAMVKRAKQIY
ncbi:MAG: type II toxin-antitoxin system RatA family toxin [Agarilytica sp.]